MTNQASESRMMAKRRKAENRRLKAQKQHVIEYFHQVDDPYSHLASQVLQAFFARYDMDLHIHIVTEQTGLNVSEPELLSHLSIGDAL
jgi:hypothetical protein